APQHNRKRGSVKRRPAHPVASARTAAKSCLRRPNRQADMRPPATTSLDSCGASYSAERRITAMMLSFFREAYQWYLTYRTPFELLGLILPVMGTLFAFLSIQAGRRLSKDLRTVSH